MYIVNSFRLLISNFTLCYKVWLYRFIVLLIILAIAAAIILPNLIPVLEDLNELGVVNMSKNLLQKIASFSTGGNTAEEFVNIISISSDVFANHASSLLRTYIAAGVLLFVFYFLQLLGEFPTAGTLLGYVELQANFGFVSSLLSNLKKALKFSIMKLAIFLPIDLVTYAMPILILIFAKGLFVYAAPFFALLLFILLISLRSVFSCCWLPHMLTEEGETVRSFKESLNFVGEKFGKIFSSFLMFYTIFIPILFALTLFSFGVFALISSAMVTVLLTAKNFVIYFSISGKRYYIDHDTIVVPKKLKDRESAFIYDLKE